MHFHQTRILWWPSQPQPSQYPIRIRTTPQHSDTHNLNIKCKLDCVRLSVQQTISNQNGSHYMHSQYIYIFEKHIDNFSPELGTAYNAPTLCNTHRQSLSQFALLGDGGTLGRGWRVKGRQRMYVVTLLAFVRASNYMITYTKYKYCPADTVERISCSTVALLARTTLGPNV